jgi:hypothetical protein
MAEAREPNGPPREDEDYALHTELGGEAKRLVTHPGEEIGRLGEEARAGETEATPAIVIGGLAIWLALGVALIIGLIVVVTFLVV